MPYLPSKYTPSPLIIVLLLASLTLIGSYPLFARFWPIAEAANPFTLRAEVVCTTGTPTVRLSWNNPNNATTYTLYRTPSNRGTSVWVNYAPGVTATTHTDTNVRAESTYQYQVSAHSAAGAVQYSDVVTLSSLSCTTPTTPVVAPTPPVSVRRTFDPSITTSCVAAKPRVQIGWSNPNNAHTYSLWRNPNMLGIGTWGIIGTTTVPEYTDLTSSAGKTYRYQITAIAVDNTIRYSDVLLSGTIPTCTTQTPIPTTSTNMPTPTPIPPVTAPKTLSWGVYSGWGDATIQEFETRTGENPNMIAQFVHWGNGGAFPTHMAKHAKDKGRTLIIFWEPSNYLIGGTDQPEFSYDAINRGNWDTYIKSFAAAAKAYGGPVILIPFSEMNGNWSPWSGTQNGNTPAKAAEGFRHVRTVFGTLPNVKFGWAINSNSVPDTAQNAIELYYPGDTYVDYVGVDGFNFNNTAYTPSWLSFDAIFGKPLTLLSKYNKPIHIFSFASAEGPQKAAWITDAMNVQMPKYPRLVGWTWFNQNKEKNWLVWSDEASLNAFKSVTP